MLVVFEWNISYMMLLLIEKNVFTPDKIAFALDYEHLPNISLLFSRINQEVIHSRIMSKQNVIHVHVTILLNRLSLA